VAESLRGDSGLFGELRVLIIDAPGRDLNAKRNQSKLTGRVAKHSERPL